MEKKKRHKSEVEIDFVAMTKALFSKLWLMALVGLIIGLSAFGATKLLIKPTYRCGFTAYVNNQHTQGTNDMLTYNDLVAAQQLTKTYNYIVKSNSVLSASLESINSDLTYGEFKNMVSAEIQDETEIISVYVVNKNPQTAYELANAVAKTAPMYMSEIVEGSSMKIVDYPVYTEKIYGPSYLRYGLLGFLLGFLIIVVIVLIKFFKDDSIKDESELEQKFSLPILGIIPDINQTNNRNTYYSSNSYGYGNTQQTQKGE